MAAALPSASTDDQYFMPECCVGTPSCTPCSVQRPTAASSSPLCAVPQVGRLPGAGCRTLNDVMRPRNACFGRLQMEPGLWVQLTEAEMAASTDADGRSLRHHRGYGWSIGAARSTHPGLPVAGESQERNSVMVVLFA